VEPRSRFLSAHSYCYTSESMRPLLDEVEARVARPGPSGARACVRRGGRPHPEMIGGLWDRSPGCPGIPTAPAWRRFEGSVGQRFFPLMPAGPSVADLGSHGHLLALLHY
jgi:hypothetical protein